MEYSDGSDSPRYPQQQRHNKYDSSVVYMQSLDSAVDDKEEQLSPNEAEKRNADLRRVKLYELDAEDAWQDIGTGHVSLLFSEELNCIAITVKDEWDSHTFFENQLWLEGDVYQQQQDTLIVWTDPRTNRELALSFQEAPGCLKFWEQIESIRENEEKRQNSLDFSAYSDIKEEVFEDGNGVSDPTLPDPTLSNLEEIEKRVSICPIFQHPQMAKFITETNYLAKLGQVFSMCEDLENMKELVLLYHIYKGIVLLNDTGVFDLLFENSDYLEHALGAFEYDPDVAEHCRLKHREFLKKTEFKEVVPLRNEELRRKVTVNYFVQYLKDVALPRVLDDVTFATLNSYIYFNNLYIVETLSQDNEYIETLLGLASQPDGDARFVDACLLLQELCVLAKNLEIGQRIPFYRTLVERGLPQFFLHSISNPQVAVRCAGVDILNLYSMTDPPSLRSVLMQPGLSPSLFTVIVRQFVSDSEFGLVDQLGDIIRTLLSQETLDGDSNKDSFLHTFYEEMMPVLAAPVISAIALKPPADDLARRTLWAVQAQVCDLLAFCIAQHGFRIKSFLLGKNFIVKVLRLLEHPETYVVLAVLRLFRALLGTKDDYYIRHIVQKNLLKPIVDLFVRNGSRYNMVNSSICELCEFIRLENIKSLVTELSTKHLAAFEEVSYVNVFELLQALYEQNAAPDDTVTPTATAPRTTANRMRDAIREESQEESYFDGDDDDPPASGGLVPYALDEDDDDDRYPSVLGGSVPPSFARSEGAPGPKEEGWGWGGREREREKGRGRERERDHHSRQSFGGGREYEDELKHGPPLKRPKEI